MKLSISDEVKRGGAVVALESSVIAQGLPHPENLHAARACEEVVRRAGAIPAIVGIIGGEIVVGLSADHVRRLADPKSNALKVGSSEIAYAVATGRDGGTTVSATCEIAARAGIRVFATGGIGGVHRGVTQHGDVSQDLWALSKFPVAIVCAGAKSVLDLPRTLEALETLAVPVVGVATNEFPSFYSKSSGLGLSQRVENAADAAKLARTRLETLGQGGMVFALPPPEATALPREEIERHLREALAYADSQKVSGKAVTPFLLKELSRRTEGRSLKANLALLEHNARFAAELAVALSRAPAAP